MKKGINQTNTSVLLNFNIPTHLKYRLDRLCYFKGVSRTSVLNGLIEQFVRAENDQLRRDGRIHEEISKLEKSIERSVLRSARPPPHKTT